MKLTRILALTSAIISFAAFPARAEQFDQPIVAIFGSGNPNTGWTTDTSADSAITVALRAKNRVTASTANTAGVYYVPVGLVPPNNNRAYWNWEFSVSTSDGPLSGYDYFAAYDTDPTVGVSYQVIDALGFADNSYGTATTLNGQGVEGPSTLAATYTVSQQSQNIVFYAQNPTVHATYEYEVYAVAKGAGPDGEKLASTTITVVVGDGGATINDLLADLAAEATNHGDYVSSVNKLVEYLYGGGVINKQESKEIRTAAARSTVGK